MSSAKDRIDAFRQRVDVVERLNMARAAMAKLTSSRKSVHVHIPPDPEDADMLICGACEDAIRELTSLRARLEAAEGVAEAARPLKVWFWSIPAKDMGRYHSVDCAMIRPICDAVAALDGARAAAVRPPAPTERDSNGVAP